jgi:hypothetical protein
MHEERKHRTADGIDTICEAGNVKRGTHDVDFLGRLARMFQAAESRFNLGS